MVKHRSMLRSGSLLILLLVIAGCAHRTPSPGQRNEGAVEIITKSEGVLLRDLRLGIFDFIDATHIKGLGSDLAQQVYQLLLKEHFVHQIERVDKDVSTLAWALDVGRERGYDLVLVGEVREFMYGGLSAHSRVSLSLRMVDPKSDGVLWYIIGTMADEPQTFVDYLLFWRTSKEAASPYHLSNLLIKEMVMIIAARHRDGTN